jgi:hypothetical protein
MKTQDAIKIIGNGRKSALAKALGIQAASVYDWGDTVPFHHQQKLEKLSEGALRAMTSDEYTELLSSRGKTAA